MRSCATRSTKRNGPEHTGFAPNLSPAACAALGDTIMPARSASCASSGEKGADRLRRTVTGSTTSTLADRRELAAPVRAGHGLVPLDVELDGGRVELLAVVEGHAGRSLSVSALLSADHSYDVASCGTMFSFSSMSNSLSQSEANTMRPTKVRASVGSRTSGSSARPMRSVCAAAGNAAKGASPGGEGAGGGQL